MYLNEAHDDVCCLLQEGKWAEADVDGSRAADGQHRAATGRRLYVAQVWPEGHPRLQVPEVINLIK